MANDSRRGYDRESIEFARVLTFSDGLFAIAMTLLVVGIEVPDIPDTESVGELWDAVTDLDSSFISFFISFFVIALLGRPPRLLLAAAAHGPGLIWLNILYLCFIAFLPFPSGLLGNFFENPLAF